MGRVLMYFRSRYAMQLTGDDMHLLSKLMEAKTHPCVLADFIQNICHCPLDDRDIAILYAYHYKRDILEIVSEWSQRPIACCLN